MFVLPVIALLTLVTSHEVRAQDSACFDAYRAQVVQLVKEDVSHSNPSRCLWKTVKTDSWNLVNFSGNPATRTDKQWISLHELTFERAYRKDTYLNGGASDSRSSVSLPMLLASSDASAFFVDVQRCNANELKFVYHTNEDFYDGTHRNSEIRGFNPVTMIVRAKGGRVVSLQESYKWKNGDDRIQSDILCRF